jgi:hydroxymethylbilane synthase
MVAAIEHPASRLAVDCERAFLAELGSGCALPVGAHAVVVGEGLELRTFLAGDGGVYEGVHEGSAADAPEWAVEAARLARQAVMV